METNLYDSYNYSLFLFQSLPFFTDTQIKQHISQISSNNDPYHHINSINNIIYNKGIYYYKISQINNFNRKLSTEITRIYTHYLIQLFNNTYIINFDYIISHENDPLNLLKKCLYLLSQNIKQYFEAWSILLQNFNSPQLEYLLIDFIQNIQSHPYISNYFLQNQYTNTQLSNLENIFISESLKQIKINKKTPKSYFLTLFLKIFSNNKTSPKISDINQLYDIIKNDPEILYIANNNPILNFFSNKNQ